MDLAISNVINISVSQAPSGIGAYNTSNLGLFSTEQPGAEFGSSGYKIYRTPSGVITDFGSSSRTASMANKVFSQRPNILAGGGYLAVIPLIVEKQTLSWGGVPTSGFFSLSILAQTTALIRRAEVAYAQVEDLTCPADVSGSLDGQGILAYDDAGSVAFWIDVDDSGTTIPAWASAADRAVEVTTILTDDTANTVATKMATAINADSKFSAPAPGAAVVTVTHTPAGARTAGIADGSGSGGFTATITTTGSNAGAAGSDATEIQSKLRALTGLEKVVVTGSYAAGFEVEFFGVYGSLALMTQASNTMGETLTIAEDTDGETINAALTRTKSLIHYLGMMVEAILPQADLLAVASSVQAITKIMFAVSRSSADVEVDGALDLLRQNSYSRTRGLYYGASTDGGALDMMAAYAGRALSTNFNGSNTTQTMHMKDLIGVTADSSMTETLFAKAQAAGVDVYASVQGVAKVLTSGANTFFDRVYNLVWFVGGIEVAGFNVLATTSTKIAQTEDGIDLLKGAYREVCLLAVTNRYAAPGSWTLPDTFGVLDDFFRNIEERGFYIYSQPVSQQLAADRAARKAPLIQIALKEAGAVHSSDVLVFVNA